MYNSSIIITIFNTSYPSFCPISIFIGYQKSLAILVQNKNQNNYTYPQHQLSPILSNFYRARQLGNPWRRISTIITIPILNTSFPPFCPISIFIGFQTSLAILAQNQYQNYYRYPWHQLSLSIQFPSGQVSRRTMSTRTNW